MLRNFIAVAVIVFIAACSMHETKIYNLDIPVEQGTIRSTADDSLVIRIDVPRYLAQPYIAYRSSPYQMEISRYSKWDASPKAMVSEGLSVNLGYLRSIAHERLESDTIYLGGSMTLP